MGAFFWRYNGLVIPCLSSSSISSPFPPPHPPYNPLHLASRFIVYFTTIIPFTPDHTPYFGLIPHSPRVLSSLSTLHCILPLLHDTRYENSLLLVPTSQLPVVRTISIPSLTPLLPFSPARSSHLPHHNGMHITHLFFFLDLLIWLVWSVLWENCGLYCPRGSAGDRWRCSLLVKKLDTCSYNHR